MNKRDIAVALRDKGLTYEAIGELFGISSQAVHQIVHRGISNRTSLGKDIIYPNLLDWSIENKCNRREFLSRMGLPYDNASKAKLSRVLIGKQNPDKDYIDKLLQATGLTYEKLFEVNPSGSEQ